jgi:hypothetical protein
MAIDVARLARGYRQSIEILEAMQDPKQRKSTKKPSYGRVPVSVR